MTQMTELVDKHFKAAIIIRSHKVNKNTLAINGRITALSRETKYKRQKDRKDLNSFSGTYEIISRCLIFVLLQKGERDWCRKDI